MPSTPELNWFATCPKGVEALLAHELLTLGAAQASETVAGVHFTGPWAVAYRACLWSRLANRVIWPLAQINAGDANALYAGLREINWGALFDTAASFAVDFAGVNDEIRNTQFGAQKSKDAIVDWFISEHGARPSVDRSAADVRINVRLVRDRAQLGIDLSGSSLHQRGYRRRAGAAPLKENLAAAILLRADWPSMAARGGALIDPLCGSGTLLIEGAMMVAGIAPGLGRRRFGFEKLKSFDSAQWNALVAQAQASRSAGLASTLPQMRGYDGSPHVIERAIANIAAAGLEKHVRVSCRPLRALTRPTHRAIPDGLLVSNPPYGERMGDKSELVPLYALLGQQMATQFPGWQAAVFTSDKDLARATGLRSHKRYTLYNGALATGLYLFNLENNNWRDVTSGAPGSAGKGDLSNGAQMLLNRLRKNRKRLRPWLRDNGIECYRLYDADMPEYAVAVDVYGDYVHVAEYKAPASVPEADAQLRMQDIRAAVPLALDVPPHRVVYKERRRQRGTSQYDKRASREEFLPVREGRATLLVNLHDYLDTGLFLDHRPLRLRIASECAGKTFLNLFCYTGTATVHAALGGAVSSVSVDSSNTYLRWFERNLARNEIDASSHRSVRADCVSWLQRAQGQYDVILLDPPSFSNSKSYDDSFDVQRDHAGLVAAVMALLRPDGCLYFSNNRRGFSLAEEVSEAFRCQDITPATLDRDFQRHRTIHRCWRITHAS
jgi:23S rRNA (guanine2445-N2)-methyltransferase / 23S rRNA (guanine2069-N7)-methyltransferase